MLRLLPASLIALAVLLLPAAASADSIVYMKGDDVWLARSDGSGARPVTRDGGYQSPTQSSDGTILAQRGTRFIRLSRSGAKLATIDSVMTGIPGNINAIGPFDPVLSPDGTKLAYWIGMYSTWHDGDNEIDWTRTGSVTVWQDARNGRILGVTHYYEDPSWLPDSSGALLFDETAALTANVVAAAVGADHNAAKQWFNDFDVKLPTEEYAKPISTGELSPSMDRLALLRGGTNSGNGGLAEGSGNTIVTYGVSLPGLPVMECHFTGANGGKFGRPSWSPAGDALTWQEGDGIWVSPIGRKCESGPKLVIPGGREPDWGPADVGGGPGPGPSGPKVTAPGSIGRSALMQRGLRVGVTCASACTAKATVKQGGRRIAGASKRLRSGGTARLALRPRRVRAGKLALRVSVKPAGKAAKTVTRTVRVR